MTVSGFIATLIALALAVLAMRLARRRPAPPPSLPRASKRTATPERKGDGPAPPTPRVKDDAGRSAQRGATAEKPDAPAPVPAKERQPLAETVFKVYSAEDDKKNPEAITSAVKVTPPEPRPRSDDWT